ncbi:MAG TPA: hypothetical protein VI076_03430 [Actinopolymorphaceae bacterium]
MSGRSAERRLLVAAGVSFVVGLALMLPFEAVVTRILGVAALFAFVVLGVFGLASPERLAARDDDR